MNDLELLACKYKTALQSDRLSDFYTNIHDYVELILSTPEFSYVVEVEKARYYSELSKAGRNSTKLERLNFYTAHWLDLYIPIYYPLHDYKTTHEPDEEQDPLALILFYGLKHPITQAWGKNIRNAYSAREGKKMLKVYSEGIDSRENLERHLRQFHIQFLTAYSPLKNTPKKAVKISPTSNIPLALNPRTGQFVYFGETTVRDTLNTKEKAFKVLRYLLASEDYFAEYPELINTYRKYNVLASTSLKSELHQVVKIIREKLGIISTEHPNENVIENIRNVGYRLTFSPQTETPE